VDIKILLLLLLIFLLYFSFLYSRTGQPKQFLDKNNKLIVNSISEKVFINVNGIKHGMYLKGKNINNPVLLFIHGGPGMPEYIFSQQYKSSIEDDFTVCWWEQRGSGLSYDSNLNINDLNSNQLIMDTLEITNYLRKRFKIDKIYLMAHSWGSFIGIKTVEKYPELYKAYIGIGQISNQLESEKIAYEFMLNKYEKEKNLKMLKKLKSFSINNGKLSSEYLKYRDELMHKAGIGTTHDMKSVISGIFLPTLYTTELTISEKINLWKGKIFSSKSKLSDELYSTDLSLEIENIKVPAYFFSGIYDYTVAYPLSLKFFEKINAPIKGFYTFKNSAHSPIFEEKERFKEILTKDVLNGKNDLVDK